MNETKLMIGNFDFTGVISWQSRAISKNSRPGKRKAARRQKSKKQPAQL
jgi:hypothetical protein